MQCHGEDVYICVYVRLLFMMSAAISLTATSLLSHLDYDVGSHQFDGKIPLQPLDGNIPLQPLDGNIPLQPLDGNIPLKPLDGNIPLQPLDGNIPLQPLGFSNFVIQAMMLLLFASRFL